MKIRCIRASGDRLPDAYLDARLGVERDTVFFVTLGKEYVVYALAIWLPQIWYYILNDDDCWFPVPLPAPLFEIIDNRVSAYWRFAFRDGQRGKLEAWNEDTILLAIEQWISDQYFYDRLSNGEDREIAIFRQMKILMDDEHKTHLTSA